MGTATSLIVDDEPGNLSLLMQLLRPVYHIRAANSGESVLRTAQPDRIGIGR